VIVTLAEDGQPRYHYGLVRKEDEATLAKSSNDTHEPPPCDEEEGKEGSAYSAALVEALTAHKTAAIATELSRQPHAALAATVYTLLLREFSVELDICSTQSALQISEQHTNLREAEDSAAGKALSERRQELLSILPRGSKLWPWCLEQTVETLLECLAFLAAISLNAVQTKADAYSGSRLVHANAIASALHMDMTHWFAPNTENFFTRISKTHIAAALAEAGKPADASRLAMKKSQLAAAAEIDIAGTGWLPLSLRVTSVKEL
jgi:ParB family chromosome partitioning protein